MALLSGLRSFGEIGWRSRPSAAAHLVRRSALLRSCAHRAQLPTSKIFSRCRAYRNLIQNEFLTDMARVHLRNGHCSPRSLAQLRWSTMTSAWLTLARDRHLIDFISHLWMALFKKDDSTRNLPYRDLPGVIELRPASPLCLESHLFAHRM